MDQIFKSNDYLLSSHFSTIAVVAAFVKLNMKMHIRDIFSETKSIQELLLIAIIIIFIFVAGERSRQGGASVEILTQSIPPLPPYQPFQLHIALEALLSSVWPGHFWPPGFHRTLMPSVFPPLRPVSVSVHRRALPHHSRLRQAAPSLNSCSHSVSLNSSLIVPCYVGVVSPGGS